MATKVRIDPRLVAGGTPHGAVYETVKKGLAKHHRTSPLAWFAPAQTGRTLCRLPFGIGGDSKFHFDNPQPRVFGCVACGLEYGEEGRGTYAS